uniref:Uncharacterized protein n=1 Tax=Tanacetum cinerariifolium TaxID=118510 RepID=A0A6L2J1I9_TANCI|nr:hypothetical protein [Tanacetum cinerariifolium]
MHKREKHREEIYKDLEAQCTEAIKYFEMNHVVIDLRKKVDTLKDTLEENQVEYGRLVLEDKRWVGYKDKLAAFEAKYEGLEKDGAKLGEVEIKLREKAIDLAKIPAYCVTNQREYDDLGNEFKNIVFSFPTEANSNPYALLEALLCKKPKEYGDVVEVNRLRRAFALESEIMRCPMDFDNRWV